MKRIVLMWVGVFASNLTFAGGLEDLLKDCELQKDLAAFYKNVSPERRAEVESRALLFHSARPIWERMNERRLFNVMICPPFSSLVDSTIEQNDVDSDYYFDETFEQILDVPASLVYNNASTNAVYVPFLKMVSEYFLQRNEWVYALSALQAVWHDTDETLTDLPKINKIIADLININRLHLSVFRDGWSSRTRARYAYQLFIDLSSVPGQRPLVAFQGPSRLMFWVHDEPQHVFVYPTGHSNSYAVGFSKDKTSFVILGGASGKGSPPLTRIFNVHLPLLEGYREKGNSTVWGPDFFDNYTQTEVSLGKVGTRIQSARYLSNDKIEVTFSDGKKVVIDVPKEE